MKIITLTEKQFNEFSSTHKYRNFYQTISYAKVMKSEGYDYHLLGFTNNSNELIGATMILYKKVFLSYKIAYAPYGFLIDYTDSDLVEELTNKLIKLLLKQKFMYVKINPNIHCSERDKKGNIVSYNPQINDIFEILQKNNYIHTGFNNYFENYKPRWNALVKLTASNNNLYTNFSKQTRNKISKAERLGITVYEGTHEDINTLFEFIKRKHERSLKYYKNILKEFKDDAKIYLAKIDTEKYLKLSKEVYEQEISTNEIYNQKLQELSRKGKDINSIINRKMESDKSLSIYQNNLVEATNLFSKYPDGIVIGGMLAIKYQNNMNLIIEGFDKKYRNFNPNYLLKWEIIKKLNNEGYDYFNLNGIVGEFNETNKYSGLNEMKLGYNASALEYIGEFDLVINKTVYNLYKKRVNKKSNKKNLKD